ncbi:MAG: hypothetical protein GZ094_02720 [Mariniphaga sp.]|nr:hypothetical protein [Mariniphaga sp.]
MNEKVFILKSWFHLEAHPYPANIFPRIEGVYSSLLQAQNEILKCTKGSSLIDSSSEGPCAKFYIIEEHHFDEPFHKTEHGFSAAPFQTWTYLSDGQLNHQSQRIDQAYVPQKKQFHVGDCVEIVDIFRNLLVAGVVFETPTTQEYLDSLRQQYKKRLAENKDSNWEIYPIEPFSVGQHDFYQVATMQGNVSNEPGYVFPISKHFSDEDRITLHNVISARKKLRASISHHKP